MSNMLTGSLRRLLGGDRGRPAAAAGRPETHENPRASTSRSLGTMEAEVIAVCAQKGGVGKTTTAVNVAAGLAMLGGRRILLLDMDPQGHCALALKAELSEPARSRLPEVLVARSIDVLAASVPTKIPGLSLCPADRELAQAEASIQGRIGKEFLLRQALRSARGSFDAIVIDCPPNLGTLTLNALLAADWLLAPCDMSTLSVEGIGDIFETVETVRETLGHHLAVLGVVKTRYDAKNRKVNDAVNHTLERWSRHLLRAHVPVNTALAQAQLAGTAIYAHDPHCRGSEAYAAVTREIARRVGLKWPEAAARSEAASAEDGRPAEARS
jgi:chromosome partitioning protein